MEGRIYLCFFGELEPSHSDRFSRVVPGEKGNLVMVAIVVAVALSGVMWFLRRLQKLRELRLGKPSHVSLS